MLLNKNEGPPGTSGVGNFTMPLPDANTVLLWKFNEASGVTVHNYGTAGDVAATQLTLSGTYIDNVGQPSCVGNYMNAGGAMGAPAQEIAGSLSMHIMFVAFQPITAFSELFGKSYQAPPAWGPAPFKSVDISLGAGGTVSYIVHVAAVDYSLATPAVLIPGQTNFMSLLFDAVGGTFTGVTNGVATTAAAAVGNINWGAHGNWYVGRNVIATDPVKGVVAWAMVENTLRTSAWSLAAYKAMAG